MSNRPAFFLWFSIRIEGKHSFRLVFFLPLCLILMLTDLVEDFSALAVLFWPKGRKRNWHGMEISPVLVTGASSAFAGLCRNLILKAEPDDLMDIEVTDEKNRIRIKCLLR